VNLLDAILIIAAVAFGVSGYRQGFVAGVLSFVGFLGGGLVGLALVPRIFGEVDGDVGGSLIAIGLVLGVAVIGQVLASVVGSRLRDRLIWQPARVADATGGAFLSVASMLIVAWFVGSAVATSALPTLGPAVRDSRVLHAVDRVMPNSAESLYRSFSSVLDENGFPRVFDPFTDERISPVEPPDPAAANSVAVRRARASIVKIMGTALSCRRAIEGTGFVYAPERVMTNAHVVSGVREPQVIVGGDGQEYSARVVVFDPQLDVAVLYVPGLPLGRLSFDDSGSRGDSAVVAGFPRNGPFIARSARIRNEITARGPNIYEEDTVTRQVFSVYGRVEPGNSGGPLLSPEGDVYGVIFAKSLDDTNTGYALTADEVRSDAGAGRGATARVATGPCA
jgi:S1-C subfamily serine protease